MIVRHVSLGSVGEVIVMLLFSVVSRGSSLKKAFEATFGVTMDDLNTVYISNLKLDMRFLLFMGYDNFVVQLGIRSGSLSKKPWAFCFVEFEHLIDANNLRNELLDVSAQIGKCMPHRYSQCENQ